MSLDEIMKTGRWNELKEGEERIFGFLQVDVAKSGELSGPDVQKQKTKANLGRVVTGILDIYGARKLSWPGDGGAFVFLVSKPTEDYDNMVTAALHVLETMPFFNAMRGSLNLLKQDLTIRISCHQGRANYSSNPEQMHSGTLDYFLKYEREIGHQNAVTITKDVYDQLVSDSIKDLFELRGEHEYTLAGQPYSKALYLSKTRVDSTVGAERFVRFFPTYLSLFDIRERMKEILHEFSKTETLKEIKIIAATGGSIIPLFNEYIEGVRPIGNTLIKMLVMDPSCPQTARAAAHWPEEARHNIEQSLPVLNDRFKKMGKKIKFEWKTYDFLPSIQGLLFGETYLFIGWWEWVDIGNKKMELTGAARPISYFEKDDANAEYFFGLFRSWFDYAWDMSP